MGNVLIIDDDEMVLETFQIVLSSSGHILGIFTFGISESWVEEGFDIATEFLFAQAFENLR